MAAATSAASTSTAQNETESGSASTAMTDSTSPPTSARRQLSGEKLMKDGGAAVAVIELIGNFSSARDMREAWEGRLPTPRVQRVTGSGQRSSGDLPDTSRCCP